MSGRGRAGRYIFWLVAAIVALAIAVTLGWSDLARQGLGSLGIPDRCTLHLDHGLSPGDFRIEYVSRDAGVRATVFEHGSCRWVPQHEGATTFYVWYRGELICIAADFKGVEFALETYEFRCTERPGRVLCSLRRDGAPTRMTCYGTNQPDRLVF